MSRSEAQPTDPRAWARPAGARDRADRLLGRFAQARGHLADLRREREEARLKWLKWWEETGRKRFLRPDGRPEGDRPTALLPTIPRGR